jgi:hypothetical protein
LNHADDKDKIMLKLLYYKKTLYAGPRIGIDVSYQSRLGKIEIDVIVLSFHHLGLGASIKGFYCLKKKRGQNEAMDG